MRIAVAVSGGVDSLCALLLLRRAGHEVMAVHGFFLHETAGPSAALPGLQAACHALDVPLHVVDLRAHFQQAVITPFAQAYAAGQTPNPCALCNRAVKFGALLEAALQRGADRLATGHYARLLHDQQGNLTGLAAAADQHKDQSYFLSLVPSARLALALFPLAAQNKADSVAMVRGAGLPIPVPRESQDICFVPTGHVAYHDVLAGQWSRAGLPTPPGGPMLLAETHEQPVESMRTVGRHQGLWRHTEGQRKGLGIAHSEALYVLRKDMQHNALILGSRSLLGMQGCRTGMANVFVPPADWPLQPLVRLRYRQSALHCRAELVEGCLHIHLEDPCFPSAPGQVAALYDKEGRVLAAGLIHDCY
ncbi:MAG: tRNA 2-thiouridine(34) synthase MnmA [Desulfovibrio sp.]|nr:tRNA 2-thiouridine(34) synthase MnmA [Desulfovibrio sp.]